MTGELRLMVEAVVLATGLPLDQVEAMTLDEVTELYWRTDRAR